MKDDKKRMLVGMLEGLLQTCACCDSIDPSDEDSEDGEIFKANQKATEAYSEIEGILRKHGGLPEWSTGMPATADNPI